MHRQNGIEFDERLAQRLREFALAHGVSEETILAEAVRDYLAARQGDTLYDAFAEAGLVGCLPGTPPDLSTNEAHFEGFGRA